MSAARDQGLEHELRRELERALRAEIGAAEFYARLSRKVRDAELANLLGQFELEQREQIRAIEAVAQVAGVVAPSGALRRRWLARALVALRPLLGQRLILRVCADAERTRAVGYAHFAEHFARTSRASLADTCRRCATTAMRHSDALSAWVLHGAGR